MKRGIVSVLVTVLLMAGSGVARAGEATEIEAGLLWWCTKWKRELSSAETVRSERAPLVGPTIEVKTPQGFFLEGAYLLSGWDYKSEHAGETAKFDRHDVDVAAGYLVLHNLGVFVGYRNSVMKEEGTGVRETVYGPVAGIKGELPLGKELSLYGSCTYLMNRLKEDAGDTQRERNNGWIVEAGGKYELSKHLSASLGVKYETTEASDTNVKDTFAGWTLAGKYAFE